jgi:uncharacterized protein with gpF-like domain
MTQEEIIRQRKSFEHSAISLFYTALMKSIEPALKALPDINTDAIQPDLIEKAYVKLYQSVGTWFAMRTKSEVEKSTSVEEDLWKQKLEQFAKTEAGERIREVWGYTQEKYKEIVRDALAAAVEEGYSTDNAADYITKAVKDKFAEFTRWRAVRIARTEIVSASNAGSLEGAKTVGDKMQKVWMTFFDGETRASHAEANGQTRELDEDFIVDGESLSVPGDPKGSAGNVINCRCTVGYERKH